MLDVLAKMSARLKGKTLVDVELATLAYLKDTYRLPDWIVSGMTEYKLSKTIFDFCESDDGEVEHVMYWLPPSFMREEVEECMPGILAIEAGYFPIGGCMFGSGDPYFVKLDDVDPANPKLFKIYHDVGSLEDLPGMMRVVDTGLADVLLKSQTRPYPV